MPKRTEEHIRQLVPALQPLAQAFLEKAKELGFDLKIIHSYRSVEEQNELYKIGRRGISGEKPVTNAKGGQSKHNFRRAFDVFDNKNGYKIDWPKLVALAESMGLVAGHRFKIVDSSHFEYNGPATSVTLNVVNPIITEEPTMEEVYKQIFIAWYTRWPNEDELNQYRELAKLGNSPYTAAQKLFIEAAQDRLRQLEQASLATYEEVPGPVFRKMT